MAEISGTKLWVFTKRKIVRDGRLPASQPKQKSLVPREPTVFAGKETEHNGCNFSVT